MWKSSNNYTSHLMHNKTVFSNLNLPENTVLFNVKNFYVDAMFYTGLTAYWFIPNYEQYKTLKEKEKTIALFNADDAPLPDYIINDKSVIIINQFIYE